MNLSKLFSGAGRVKPTFEFKSAKVGPFSGKRMSVASNDAAALDNFIARNKDKKPVAMGEGVTAFVFDNQS